MKSILKKTLFSLMFICLLFLCVSVTNVKAADESTGDNLVATFEFGENDSSKTHTDGTSTSTYSASDSSNAYKLELSELAYCYKDAFDNKGNSCLKLGTSNYVGKFSFTVPENVTRVEILVAKYKAKNSVVSVNDINTTLTKSSDNGEYDVISVETGTAKTVNFATTSSGKRCMINTIKWYEVDKSSLVPSIAVSKEVICSVNETTNIAVIANNFSETPEVTINVTDATVATVEKVEDAYQITGLAKGTTTVKFTATYGEETAEASCTITVYPSNAKCLSVAEALEICKEYGEAGTGVEYTVKGYVSEVTYTYNSNYNNVSFNLVDNIGDSTYIEVFRLKGGKDIEKDDYCYITGKLKVYNSKNEIDTPQTYVNVSNKLNSLESQFSLAYQYDNNDGVLSNSEFRFRLGVAKELASAFASVKAESKEYGLKVEAGDKTEYYAFDADTLTDDTNLYMILSLGDIINDAAKLSTEFKVCAYVKVDGVTVASATTKTYSVKTLVEHYYGLEQTKDLVTPLYNLLNKDNK